MTNPTDDNLPTLDDNPHRFEPHVLEALANTSGKMYDEFYDLLATYQFDFTLEEKGWMLARITNDITRANEAAEEGDFH